jgi:hypothetical protein
LDDAPVSLVIVALASDLEMHERRSIMFINAQGTPRDSAVFGPSPRYRDAVAGLRTFDDLSRTIGQRRDAVVRGVAAQTHGTYPQPDYSAPAAAGTMIGAAVAAFVGSEAGRAAIERAVSAASNLIKGVLGAAAGPTQMPLPFE